MSNGIDKNPLLDISKVYLEQIVEKKDDSYLEPDMKKRQANNEKARKEMAKVKGQKNPHFEERKQEWNSEIVNSLSDAYKVMQEVGNVDEMIDPKGAARMDAAKGKKKETQDEIDKRLMLGKHSPAVKYAKTQKEGLDPVGQEDGDIDNDGDKDKSDKYLAKRRKAIGNAIKGKMKKEETDVDKYIETVAKVKEVERKNDIQRWVQKESRTSNWRQDLSEIMTDDVDSKPIKEKNVKNKIKINPKLGEAIEEIGGTVVEMVEVDEEMTVTNADKKGNTPAYQAYKAGKKDKSGKPMYKAADHMKEGDGDPCWDSHKQVGMKKKGGKMVPNCVPKNEEVEVEEGMKPLPKNKMFRKAGNLGRDVVSPSVTDDQRQKAYDRSKKIVKTLNKANEEVEVDEAMMAGPRKDAMKKKEYSAKSGSDRATAFNIGTRRDVSVSDPKIKSRGGRTDKRTGEGDRGMGNAAKRRMKEDASMSPQELQLQKKKAMIDRMIAQKRQQGLNKAKKSEAPTKAMGEEALCAHSVKGKECPVHGKKDCSSMGEATEDSLRDRRMERGGVDGNNRYKSAPKNVAMGGGKKKPYDGMSALEKVKASIRAKHGQGAIMDTKKK
jgi:hypothetical protein